MSLGAAYIDVIAKTDKAKADLLELKKYGDRLGDIVLKVKLDTKAATDALRAFRKEAAKGVSTQLKLDVSQAVRAIRDLRAETRADFQSRLELDTRAAATKLAELRASNDLRLQLDTSAFNAGIDRSLRSAQSLLDTIREVSRRSQQIATNATGAAQPAAAGSGGGGGGASAATSVVAAALGARAAVNGQSEAVDRLNATLTRNVKVTDAAKGAATTYARVVTQESTALGKYLSESEQLLARIERLSRGTGTFSAVSRGAGLVVTRLVQELAGLAEKTRIANMELVRLGHDGAVALRETNTIAARAKSSIVDLGEGYLRAARAADGFGGRVDRATASLRESLAVAREAARVSIAPRNSGSAFLSDSAVGLLAADRATKDLRDTSVDAERVVARLARTFTGFGSAAVKAGGAAVSSIAEFGTANQRLLLAAAALPAAFYAIQASALAAAAGVSALALVGVSAIQSTTAVLDTLKGTIGSIGVKGLTDDLRAFSSETGVSLTALSGASAQLLALGFNGTAAEKRVKDLTAALGASGLTGAGLEKGLGTLVGSIQAIANSGKFDARGLGSITAILPSVNQRTVLANVAKDLGITTKAALKLNDAGKLTANQGLKALFETLNQTGKNGLDTLDKSVAQSFSKIKQQVLDSFAQPFLDAVPTIISAIQRLGGTLADIGKSDFVKQVADALPKFIDQIQQIIPPLTKAFGEILPSALATVRQLTGLFVELSNQLSSFFSAANDKTSGLREAAHGVAEVFRAAIDVIRPTFPIIGGIVSVAGSLLRILGDVAKFLIAIVEPINKIFGPAVQAAVSAVAFGFSKIADAADFLAGAASHIEHAFDSALLHVIGAIEGTVKAFRASAKFLHLPDFGASDVIAQLEAIKGTLASIPAVTTAQVVIDVTVDNRSTGDPFSPSVNGELPGSLVAEGNGGVAKASADAANAAAAAVIPTFTGAGNAAADAAKAAADKIKQARATLKAALASFAKDISSGDVGSIRTALSTLKTDVKAVASGAIESSLLTAISKARAALTAMAKDLAKINTQLAAAKAANAASQSDTLGFGSLTTIASGLDSIAQSAIAAKTALVDLSRVHIITPDSPALTNTLTPGTAGVAAHQASVQELETGLAARLAAVAAFQANLKKLAAKGLSADQVAAIAVEGVDKGSGLAATLADATAKQISDLNSQDSRLRGLAKSLGSFVADATTSAAEDAGKAVAVGIVAGITNQRGALLTAMRDLADALVAQIKKSLKIHSPSVRLGQEVGRHIIPGLLAPVIAGHGQIRDAMADVGDSLAAVSMPRFATPTLASLTAAADVAARSDLAGALRPPTPPRASSTGMSDRQHSELITALQSVAAGRVYNTPVTQNFHQSGHDPHAVANALSKAVNSLR